MASGSLHIRAVSSGGQWSATTHRAIRVDADADHRTRARPGAAQRRRRLVHRPLAVTVDAADGDGSGVAGIETSSDGTFWQDYAVPVAFAADTAGTTFYARATDAAGNVSAPVTTTFKLDLAAPNSHVSGGQGAGAWIAQVVPNAAGNETLVLGGAIAEGLSGTSGFSLEYDGLDWTGATAVGSWYPLPDEPQIEFNWYFTATHQIGAGNHIFMGRAQDAAGNQEAPYDRPRAVAAHGIARHHR